MIRPPPRSTLFPYTRSSDLDAAPVGALLGANGELDRLNRPAATILRSEEHTSELQSHHDLVCRLLLEKKKKLRCRIWYEGISAGSGMGTTHRFTVRGWRAAL